MSSQLTFAVDDRVASITLTRPACRNALSRELLAQLSQAIKESVALQAHAVVIAGDGGFFSAGADFRELEGSAADAAYDDEVAGVVDVIQSAPIPVIAAIEGACIGAALDLAMACDLRVIAMSAYLELPAIRMGLLYNPRALARMGRQLPATTLTRLLLLGERFVGQDAVDSGIASHTVPDGQVIAKCMEIASRLRCLPSRAVETTKRFIGALNTSTFELNAWQAERMELLVSPERRDAVARARARLGD